MRHIWHFPILFLCLVLLPWRAYSAAWLQQEGHGQFISSFSYYHSDQFFDKSGHTQDNTTFSKPELSRYLEYGFSPEITLGANARFAYAQADDNALLDQFNSGSFDSTNFSHSEINVDLFFRHKLYEKDGFIATIQPLVSLPEFTYNAINGLELQKNRYALELRGLLGYSFQWRKLLHQQNTQKGYSGQWHFANMEFAYRRVGRYAPNVVDELKIDSTLGLRPSEAWLIMAQNFTTIGAKSTNNLANIGLSKIQLSAVWQYNDRQSVQLGVFQDIWGKQAGKGQGVLLAIWAGF